MPANTAEVLRQVEASGVVPGGWVGEAMLGLAQLHHHWKSSRDFSALTVKRFIVKNNQDFSPTKALRAVLDARHGDRPAGHWVTNDHNIQRSPIGRCGIRMESERSILFHQYLRKDRGRLQLTLIAPGSHGHSEMSTTLLQTMIWHTSNLVVLDSGLCVLKGLIELRKKGVFAYALIKKRRCWPKFICGDEITNHFQDKEVGAVDAWPGTLDRNPFHVADDNIWENEAGWRSAWEEGGQKRRKTFDIQR
ncbi:hypothetical protein IV203_034480 [Nitzschia inconspicua]|uniref:Transposase n=1 Tax=Nitzschia inconspicua TaxID=303405 RepID=A0A9K3K956_9STRA|nr:hypothetical protein IV203_002537 [Nitzschia inconspicua]KAG7359382.1 hypothetical protein IV203_034480 [Nitzschia inconspicua]